jgi:cytochrome c oxidase cbb3-type subunit 2
VKTGFRVFIAAFVALGASWCGFVLAPVLQLGTEKQTAVLNSSDTYPVQRTGDATLGLQVYRASGCAACHTEQIQQSGFACDVVLTSAGKNPSAVSNLISTLKLTGLTKDEADSVSSKITSVGGKAETHILATGADISRGWGIRRSVAEDFLWDDPVQPGSIRVGSDLANIGVRAPDANWQLLHLYSPQSVTKNSAMPPFRFLFETQKISGTPSPDALRLSGKLAPPAGYEVVPTEDAKNLGAYLLSLRADMPLYDAPFTSAQVSTNAPAGKK